MSIVVRVTPFAPESRAYFTISPEAPSASAVRALEGAEITSPGDQTLVPFQKVRLSSLRLVQTETRDLSVGDFLSHLIDARPDLTLLGARAWASLKEADICDFKRRMRTLDRAGNQCVTLFAALIRKDGELMVPRIRFRRRYNSIVWGTTHIWCYQTLPSGFLAIQS